MFGLHKSGADGVYGPKGYELPGPLLLSSLLCRGLDPPHQWGTLEIAGNQTSGRSRIDSHPTGVIQSGKRCDTRPRTGMARFNWSVLVGHKSTSDRSDGFARIAL